MNLHKQSAEKRRVLAARFSSRVMQPNKKSYE